MFSQLIFLIMVLFLIIESPASSSGNFFASIGLYLATLVSLRVLSRLLPLWIRFPICQTLLLTSLAIIFYYFLVPVESLFLRSCLGLLLYFGGSLAQASNMRRGINQIRFIAPFALPFFIMTALPISIELTLVIALITFCLLPWILKNSWSCHPLPPGPLKERLERLCQKAQFMYGGLCSWGVMSHVHTAAIVGVLPRFRYILFTQSLLNQLTPESVEAVLAHEIGHSKHRHLLFYPFLFLSLLLTLLLFDHHTTLSPLAEFFVTFGIIGLFIRFVFGFFSRQFERQADLYALTLDLNPHHMICALSTLGAISGTPLTKPNWHHYSLQERINFIERAIQNPQLIEQHHRKVRILMGLYFCLLLFMIYLEGSVL